MISIIIFPLHFPLIGIIYLIIFLLSRFYNLKYHKIKTLSYKTNWKKLGVDHLNNTLETFYGIF